MSTLKLTTDLPEPDCIGAGINDLATMLGVHYRMFNTSEFDDIKELDDTQKYKVLFLFASKCLESDSEYIEFLNQAMDKVNRIKDEDKQQQRKDAYNLALLGDSWDREELLDKIYNSNGRLDFNCVDFGLINEQTVSEMLDHLLGRAKQSGKGYSKEAIKIFVMLINIIDHCAIDIQRYWNPIKTLDMNFKRRAPKRSEFGPKIPRRTEEEIFRRVEEEIKKIRPQVEKEILKERGFETREDFYLAKSAQETLDFVKTVTKISHKRAQEKVAYEHGYQVPGDISDKLVDHLEMLANSKNLSKEFDMAVTNFEAFSTLNPPKIKYPRKEDIEDFQMNTGRPVTSKLTREMHTPFEKYMQQRRITSFLAKPEDRILWKNITKKLKFSKTALEQLDYEFVLDQIDKEYLEYLKKKNLSGDEEYFLLQNMVNYLCKENPEEGLCPKILRKGGASLKTIPMGVVTVASKKQTKKNLTKPDMRTALGRPGQRRRSPKTERRSASPIETQLTKKIGSAGGTHGKRRKSLRPRRRT